VAIQTVHIRVALEEVLSLLQAHKHKQMVAIPLAIPEVRDLMSSRGSAMTLPHFLHLAICNGSYIGIMTLTLGSGLGCSIKSLSTEMGSNVRKPPTSL
jgi:hypothetical protein